MRLGPCLSCCAMTDFVALLKEIDETVMRSAIRPRHVRICPTAIPGSIVSLAIPPERARRLGFDGYEILLHPHDWFEMRLDVDLYRSQAVTSNRVCGLPVVN